MRWFQAILLSCATLVVSVVAGIATDARHVVLVHGIHDEGESMKTMADHLSSKGWSVHVSPYAPSDGSVALDILAQQLASYVNKEVPQGRKFDLVAFSMGGLVSRFYIQNLGGSKRMRRFVEISVPNHGTWVACLLWNAGGRQMRPKSDFLRALNGSLDSYEGIPWLTVRTPLDLTIIPSASTEMAQSKNVKAWVLFHPLMVSDKHVNEIVADFLICPDPIK